MFSYIIYFLIVLLIIEIVFTIKVALERKEILKEKKFSFNSEEIIEKGLGKEGQVCAISENISKMKIFEFVYFIDIKNNYLLDDLIDGLLTILKHLIDAIIISLLIIIFPLTILIRAILGIGDSKEEMKQKAKDMIR